MNRRKLYTLPLKPILKPTITFKAKTLKNYQQKSSISIISMPKRKKREKVIKRQGKMKYFQEDSGPGARI